MSQTISAGRRIGRGGFFVFLFCFLNLLPLFAQPREDSARIYFFHALKAKEEGRLLTAERLFRKALEIEPQNPDFHFELGSLYAERDRFDPARKEYEQAIMISPNHVAARYNLGLVYRELGRMTEARDQFRKVLEIDPNHIKAQMQIGYIYQEEGFIEEAREAFRKAQEMDISDPEPQGALEDLGEYEQKLRETSNAQMQRNFQEQNQRAFDLLHGDRISDPGAPESQISPKQALAQAGAALIQELFARRASSEDDKSPS